MMGRESKVGSVFSWADEVEKEEEEEAAAAAASGQAQPQQWHKKPNPFGSARPREVVLQDKGIEWRQLDLHLQQSSPSLYESPRYPPVRSPQVTSTPQIRSPILLVPPLRYPPKYVAGFLYEHYQHFRPEKENKSPRGGKLNNLKSESAMCEIGNTGGRRTTELVEGKEGQQKGITLERKANFHGLPLVNQKIGTPHKSRRQLRNIQDDRGMDENESTEHKWQKVTKKRNDLSVKQVSNSLGRNKKKNFEKKGVKLQT